MMRLFVTHVVITGPNGGKVVAVNSLARLLRNVNVASLVNELVRLVKKKEMSYLAFREEEEALPTLCNALYTRENGGDELGVELLEVLKNAYRLANDELKRLHLDHY